MTVVGDKIGNLNTTAYKSNRPEFANVLSSSTGGNNATGSVGCGVEFWAVNAQWSYGSLANSTSSTDLAINGQAFIIVQGESGANYYIRTGNFAFDREGYLVNPGSPSGSKGMGLMPTLISPPFPASHIPGDRISPPAATTKFNFDINPTSAAVQGDTYTMAQMVYDSPGNAMPMSFIFTRQAASRTWPDMPRAQLQHFSTRTSIRRLAAHHRHR